ncbi:MAG: hypothetical protein E7330_04935 [Clostridiales bacterium]|nr:hypothetical protein [Clostridiales bacterium]
MQCFIFDPIAGGFSRHTLRRGDIIPFTEKAPLYLYEFLGSTRNETCWTDRRFLESYCTLKSSFPLPFSAFGGFRRAAPEKPLCTSRRTAGLTLHLGHCLSPKDREDLRRFALKSGLFSRVAPEHEAPTWVQIEGYPLCPCGLFCPFPKLEPDEKSVHVFALQDALSLQGFPPDAGLTGCFCPATARALALFCKSRGRTYRGTVTEEIWRTL